MTQHINLVGLVGSLRTGSFNRAVLTAAQTLLRADVSLSEINLREVPLSDGDLEAAGDPPAVIDLKEACGPPCPVHRRQYESAIRAVPRHCQHHRQAN